MRTCVNTVQYGYIPCNIPVQFFAFPSSFFIIPLTTPTPISAKPSRAACLLCHLVSPLEIVRSPTINFPPQVAPCASHSSSNKGTNPSVFWQSWWSSTTYLLSVSDLSSPSTTCCWTDSGAGSPTTTIFLSWPLPHSNDDDLLVKGGSCSNILVSARARYSSTGIPRLWGTAGRVELDEQLLASGPPCPASFSIIDLGYLCRMLEVVRSELWKWNSRFESTHDTFSRGLGIHNLHARYFTVSYHRLSNSMIYSQNSFIETIRIKTANPLSSLQVPLPERTPPNLSSLSCHVIHCLYLPLAFVCVPRGRRDIIKAIVRIHTIIVIEIRAIFSRMHVEERFPRFFLIVVMPSKVIALGADSVVAIPSRIRAYFVRPEWVINWWYCLKCQHLSVKWARGMMGFTAGHSHLLEKFKQT